MITAPSDFQSGNLKSIRDTDGAGPAVPWTVGPAVRLRSDNFEVHPGAGVRMLRSHVRH